jgi:hypothetical protein
MIQVTQHNPCKNNCNECDDAMPPLLMITRNPIAAPNTWIYLCFSCLKKAVRLLEPEEGETDESERLVPGTYHEVSLGSGVVRTLSPEQELENMFGPIARLMAAIPLERRELLMKLAKWNDV